MADGCFKSVFRNFYKSDIKEEEFERICDNSDLANGILCFSGLGLAKNSIKVLTKVLQTCSDVTVLDLSQSLLDNECLQTIFGALNGALSVEKVSIDSNRLNHDALLSLAAMIKENTTIQQLSLQWCNLGELYEAALILFTCIGENTCLERLDLSNNGLMSSLAKSLALSGMKPSISLGTIDLSWNKIGDNGASYILDVLKVNKNIQRVILGGNGISSPLLTAIDSQLSSNVQLHLKHAEMMSKTVALNNELSMTKTRLDNDICKLKQDYENLEARGATQEGSLLFEIGRLEDRLRERNMEFGALVEKLALTAKALEVAEEKIEHLDKVDKARNEHFQELQQQCAAHEKAHREDWIQREQQLMKFAEEQSKEAHLAKLKATELDEDLSKQVYRNKELEEKVRHLMQEEDMLNRNHKIILTQLEADNDQRINDLQQKLYEVKSEHKLELKEMSDHKEKLMEVKISEIEECRRQILELKSQASRESEENLKEIETLKDRYKIKLDDTKADHETQLKLIKAKMDACECSEKASKEELRRVKEEKNQLELSLERRNQENKEITEKFLAFQNEKGQLRELVKIEFEKELSEGRKATLALEQSVIEVESLKAEIVKLKDELSSLQKATEAKNNLNKDEIELLKKQLVQVRRDEKHRAHQLLDAVKLYASCIENGTNEDD